MKKAIGSRIDLNNMDIPHVAEFRKYIDEFFDEVKIKKLDNFDQHFRTSRLQHSLNVAYYSFLIARKIGADPRAAARAGLLHDLYWYDWHTKKTPQLHAFLHPRLAVRNAARIVDDLSEREADAIAKHMWPLCMGFPRYKESLAVTLADKYAAALEVTTQCGRFFGESSVRKARGSVKRVKAIFDKIEKNSKIS